MINIVIEIINVWSSGKNYQSDKHMEPILGYWLDSKRFALDGVFSTLTFEVCDSYVGDITWNVMKTVIFVCSKPIYAFLDFIFNFCEKLCHSTVRILYVFNTGVLWNVTTLTLRISL